MWNLFIETYIHSYMFNLQPPSKYSPFDAIHLSRHFSTIQNSFWTCRFWSFSASAIFCFTSSTSAKYFPLRTFFTQGNKKKVTQVNREGGAQGSCRFLVINYWSLSAVWAGACKSPITKWANKWSLQKKFTEAERSLSQHHQLVPWSRWVPRTRTYRGKPAPQGARPLEDNSTVFGGWPPHKFRICRGFHPAPGKFQLL